jgi:curved DNA-binding protein CbpA
VDFGRDYYEIMGLESKATSDDIKKAYRELAKKYHPDINRSATSEELFKLISEAYEVLSDDAKRKEYDLYRKFELGEGHEFQSYADGGTTLGNNVPGTEVKRPSRPAPARHVDVDRPQILVLSLIVPGYYQMVAGQKNFGYLIFAIYFIFWLLAFAMSLPLGILAILVWIYSFYDAYSHSGKEARP